MKASPGEKLFYALNYLVLTVIGITCVMPLIHLLALSFSDQPAVISGQVGLWPVGWNLESYNLLFKGTQILPAFANSVKIMVVGTLLSIGFTILAAYPLSKRYFFGRKTFTMMLIFTMLFSAGLIPGYLLIKSLGMVNTYWALWLPALVSVYNTLVLKTFFENIPAELDEAARMDGCNEWWLIGRIYIPLAVPAIATLILFYAVGYWNMFQNVLIYINSPAKQNLTVIVQQMIMNSMLQVDQYLRPEEAIQITPESIKSSGVIVMILPMLIVYPFVQKHFVKGVMIGSVKG
ncbi:carbohydrate ABC transporter permease [Paenibacillus qinlingensis]|uniref:Aldouronate transport system permease protein n=1 Tax=Paenibacillus qinlingensis TaxID=1837343 RepID=A0ABU1NNI5_9BACL|nr:carbohydrate ABC transporter permease [Paenibacillus qinlingensis]MDR6549041.1 putative aldouronate transport system permease protein [Paenibacillus qinlingensis]